MIYVVSGEDVVSSRKKLIDLLVGKSSIIRLDGKKNTIAELDEALSSRSLFSDTRTVVVEHFSKLKPEAKAWNLLKEHYSALVNGSKDTVIMWDEIDISKKKFSKGIQVFNFAFPKFYYQFLDSFVPNSKESIELLANVLETFEPEQILYGLIRRVRQLLVIKSNNHSEFSEFKRMKPWQISKLKKQANLWSKAQLKKAFLALAELDEKMKTSNLPMPLAHHLDILMLSDLN